jgi:hypothetical protein
MDEPIIHDATAGAVANRDEEHLRLLAVGCYVVGAVTAACACVFIFHFAMGWAMLHDPTFFTSGSHAGKDMPPRFVAEMFMMMGGLLVLGGWLIGGMTIYAGRCLQKRQRYMLIMVVGGLNCLLAPYGTVLGVFIFLVLTRPSVRALFPQ